MEHDAFLAAILRDPDDDLPRLVYADWLEEHGDPRAEFIRCQCALETTAPDDPARPALAARERALLKLHEEHWTEGLRGLAEEWQFRRGFVSDIRIRPGRLLAHAADLFAKFPLRGVAFAPEDAGDEELAEWQTRLADCPQLAALSTLDMSWSLALGPDGVRTLLASPHLRGIAALTFGDEDSSVATARALAECTNLPRLTALCFAGDYASDLGDAGLAELAGSEHLAGLTSLILLNNGIGPRGARALAESPFVRRLELLHFGEGSYESNVIGPAGLEALAGSPNVAGLTTLRLPFNAVEDAGARALAASPHLGRLTFLELSAGNISPAGAEALAGSPNLRNLTSLSLRYNAIGTRGLRAVAGSPHLGRLRILSLQQNEIGDEGLEALAGSPVLDSITHLDLRQNALGDRGVSALAASPGARRLTSLWLYENRIGSAGVTALAGSEHLAGLTDLGLSNNPIGEDGLRALVESPYLRHIERLSLHQQMPEAARKALKQRFGDRLK